MTSGVLAFLPTGFSMAEMMVVGVVALLLFGKRLPEVARSLGKGLVEFKKGISGIEDDVRNSVHSAPSYSRPDVEDTEPEVTAPKFEPPVFEREEEQSPA